MENAKNGEAACTTELTTVPQEPSILSVCTSPTLAAQWMLLS